MRTLRFTMGSARGGFALWGASISSSSRRQVLQLCTCRKRKAWDRNPCQVRCRGHAITAFRRALGPLRQHGARARRDGRRIAGEVMLGEMDAFAMEESESSNRGTQKSECLAPCPLAEEVLSKARALLAQLYSVS